MTQIMMRVGPSPLFNICSVAATLIHRAAAPGTMAFVLRTSVAECHMSPAATSMLETQSAPTVHTDSGDM